MPDADRNRPLGKNGGNVGMRLRPIWLKHVAKQIPDIRATKDCEPGSHLWRVAHQVCARWADNARRLRTGAACAMFSVSVA